MRSWELLKKKPHPWPADPANPGKILSQGEMRGDQDYAVWNATAAACYYRLTGKKESRNAAATISAHALLDEYGSCPPSGSVSR